LKRKKQRLARVKKLTNNNSGLSYKRLLRLTKSNQKRGNAKLEEMKRQKIYLNKKRISVHIRTLWNLLKRVIMINRKLEKAQVARKRMSQKINYGQCLPSSTL
jgi:hypothetical protein